jgi:hypothetical protein
MTKRYFYTDPLAAAWMAKHFGMRFISWDSGKEYEEFMPIYNAGSPIEKIREDQRYVVHPDSLPLLEPMVGDLIYITESKIGTLTRQNGDHLKLFTGDWLIKPDHVSIIRRDGKPFFWPESEEAD